MHVNIEIACNGKLPLQAISILRLTDISSAAVSNIQGMLSAPDAVVCHAHNMVRRTNLNDSLGTTAGAIDTLHAAFLTGGLFVPCKVHAGMNMRANASAMLLTVAHAFLAVGAYAVVFAITGIVTAGTTDSITVAHSANFTAEMAAAHVVNVAALILKALAALIDKLEVVKVCACDFYV